MNKEIQLKIVRRICWGLGLALSCYLMVVAWVGTPQILQHRPLVAGVVLFILFLTRDIHGKKGNCPAIYDYVLAVLALSSCVFVFFNTHWYTVRFMLNTPMSFWEVFFGATILILVLEAGRRTLGLAMPIICMIVILYARFGKYLPYPFRHRGYTFAQIIDVLTTSLEGVWGSPTHAATTFVGMFVIFGALSAVTGMGKFFMDFALSITGKYAGGPAKTSVISSGLMGTIQGSSISNVVTTGVFTIPAMKKYGFSNDYAGAVEAVASTGGQIMPPIMGASAFIMADMIGIPYMTVAKYAIIPALLYYACVFSQIHFKAKSLGLVGFPKEELPRFFRDVVLREGLWILPIVSIVYLTLHGYSLMRAGLIAVLMVVIFGMLFSDDRKKTAKEMVNALARAPQSMATVISAVMSAGMIIGVVFISSLGLRLSSIIVTAAGGKLILALLLTFVLGILLGMGMPTSGSYIVMGTLLAPALIKLNMSAAQAHMFVFYIACMSSITPPVAVAAYAAAGISGGNASKTGYIAWRMAIVAFIIPFMFAYQPDLLMMNGFSKSILVLITALIGVVGLAASLEGYLLEKSNVVLRILLGVGGLALMYPGSSTDLVGLALIAAVVIYEIIDRKRHPENVVKTRSINQIDESQDQSQGGNNE